LAALPAGLEPALSVLPDDAAISLSLRHHLPRCSHQALLVSLCCQVLAQQ